MQQSDALILYSRYETFGCVVIEANAFGITGYTEVTFLFLGNILSKTKQAFLQNQMIPQSLADSIINFMQQRKLLFTNWKLPITLKSKFGYEVIKIESFVHY